jgi:hypothetical protein
LIGHEYEPAEPGALEFIEGVSVDFVLQLDSLAIALEFYLQDFRKVLATEALLDGYLEFWKRTALPTTTQRGLEFLQPAEG